MAWIEQTKKGSRSSGGPQYYLQDLSANCRDLLRHKQRCPVRLWTPYGVVSSGLVAVSSAVGKVGHDRVQSGRRVPSIADQIAVWYGLRASDIEHIEFHDSFDDECFVIRPSKVKFWRKKNVQTIYPDTNPLTLTAGHRSSLLLARIRWMKRCSKADLEWVVAQIRAMVEEHAAGRFAIDERDLLRASGALSKLGIDLGVYRARGIDCPDATFQFADLPPYCCPVEIEEKSSGFLSAHHAAHRKQRVVLLCMGHDEPAVAQGYVDVLELQEVAKAAGE